MKRGLNVKLHKIDLSEEFADAVLSGDKSFEVRDNDRGYQKGDLIRFNVVDKYYHESINHPLIRETYLITYVLSGWGIKEGYVVFGIKNVIALAPEDHYER